jgi:hypothetical protein
MTVLAIRQTVADYPAWKRGFDEHGATRKHHGATRDQVLQSVDDPNDVLVLVEFGSPAQAHAFAADPSLKEAMSKAGIVGAPDISFRSRIDEVTY